MLNADHELETDSKDLEIQELKERQKLSFEERIEAHENSRRLLEDLKVVGDNLRARSQKLLELLLENKVDFVLVGGFASVVHGSTIVTQDLDICAAITPDQIHKLRNTLREFNPKHRMNPNSQDSFLDESKDLSHIKNIYLKTDLGILDIMSEQPPVGTFERINKNAIKIKLYGYECKVISIDDLIEIKKVMTRPKDKETLRILLELKKLKET